MSDKKRTPKKGTQSAGTGKGKSKPPAPKLLASSTFTKEGIAFAQAAKSLDMTLKETYGPRVTISNLEQCFEEISSGKVSAEMLSISKEIFNMYSEYYETKTAFEAVRQSFRSSLTVSNVGANLEEIRSKFTQTDNSQ